MADKTIQQETALTVVPGNSALRISNNAASPAEAYNKATVDLINHYGEHVAVIGNNIASVVALGTSDTLITWGGVLDSSATYGYGITIDEANEQWLLKKGRYDFLWVGSIGYDNPGNTNDILTFYPYLNGAAVDIGVIVSPPQDDVTNLFKGTLGKLVYATILNVTSDDQALKLYGKMSTTASGLYWYQMRVIISRTHSAL